MLRQSPRRDRSLKHGSDGRDDDSGFRVLEVHQRRQSPADGVEVRVSLLVDHAVGGRDEQEIAVVYAQGGQILVQPFGLLVVVCDQEYGPDQFASESGNKHAFRGDREPFDLRSAAALLKRAA